LGRRNDWRRERRKRVKKGKWGKERTGMRREKWKRGRGGQTPPGQKFWLGLLVGLTYRRILWDRYVGLGAGVLQMRIEK